MKLRRSFVDLPYGQVHCWRGGSPGKLPLLVIHPGPGTARCQLPLLERLAATRPVIAPDIMGMGDSEVLPQDSPDISDFATAMLSVADACGLTQFDLLGSSLGGRIAIEIALQAPQRVRKLALNRVVDTAADALEAMKQFHAPRVEPELSGSYVMFVWSRMRDLYQYFPWFKRRAENHRKRDLPSAEVLHTAFIEHIKMCTTSYRAFDAGWRYPLRDKLPLVTVPTMARKDAATMVPKAQLWEPALSEEPLTANAAHLDAFAHELAQFLDA